MRLSSARSGPSANGISVTTTRKNSTPISAPPPTRTAMRMSRTRMAASEVMRDISIAAVGAETLIEVQLPRAVEPERRRASPRG